MHSKLGHIAALLALPLTVVAQNNAAVLTNTDTIRPAVQQPQNSGANQSKSQALYQQAQLAIEKGQFTLAEQLLHEVIKADANWPGAWLDLGLLAFRQENYAQAEEFLIVLEERFSPLPEPIQLAVQQLKKKLAVNLRLAGAASLKGAEEVASGLQHQTAISLATGHDNNVNAGIRFNTITLTLADRNLELSVLSSNMPVAASFVRAGLVHQVKLPITDGALTFQVQAQGRSYSALPQYANFELVPQVSIEHMALPGQLTLGVQGVALNHAMAYRTPIMRWQIEQPVSDSLGSLLSACKVQQEIQLEQRQYLMASHLNSHWWGVKPALSCEGASVRATFYIQHSQENAASSSRPGGDTAQRLFGVSNPWLNPFGLEDHSFQVKFEQQNSKDSSGYSYLLENGANRTLQSRRGTVAWLAPLPQVKSWRWSLAAHSIDQQSNIVFFKQRSFSLESSIWRAW